MHPLVIIKQPLRSVLLGLDDLFALKLRPYGKPSTSGHLASLHDALTRKLPIGVRISLQCWPPLSHSASLPHNSSRTSISKSVDCPHILLLTCMIKCHTFSAGDASKLHPSRPAIGFERTDGGQIRQPNRNDFKGSALVTSSPAPQSAHGPWQS